MITLAVHAAVLLPSRSQPTRRAATVQSLVCGSVDARCSCARCAPRLWPAILAAARDGAAEDDAPPEGDFVGQPVTDAAIASLRWYKRTISPLLPPGCRFVPTCSEYAVQSFQRFSPPQAPVLTAWRLVRCNPTGGQGVDEPVWPPPAYNGGSGIVRTALDDAESRAKAAGSAARRRARARPGDRDRGDRRDGVRGVEPALGQRLDTIIQDTDLRESRSRRYALPCSSWVAASSRFLRRPVGEYAPSPPFAR